MYCDIMPGMKRVPNKYGALCSIKRSPHYVYDETGTHSAQCTVYSTGT